MKKIILKNEDDTIKFADDFATQLKGGEIIGLIGDLGVGKTFFTKALGKALGVKEVIKSPSFNLMKVYNIKNSSIKSKSNQTSQPPLSGGLKGSLCLSKKQHKNIKTFVHVDCYRLDSSESLIDIGLLDYFNQDDSIAIIEWADKVRGIFPKKTKFVEFKQIGDEKRLVKVL